MNEVLNLNALEEEVNQVLKRPVPRPEDLGRLSAEAVMTQFEHAAKAWLDMGTEVKDRIQKLEQHLREADKDLKLLAECADMIREKGKLASIQMEEATAFSTELRDLANGFMSRGK
jgi:hypothetical protein